MAIPIKLFKSESDTPWGFRLVGGQEFDQPIVVVKVNENSLADSAGLEVGDIIVRINDDSTAGLIHGEVHDLLQSAGCELELGIRRGEISTNIFSDENFDIEDSTAIRRVIEEEIVDKAVEIVDNLKSLRSSEQKSINGKFDHQEPQAIEQKITLRSTSDVEKGQKWSTFLVKLDKPIPKPKRKLEEPKLTGEEYQVVIKKQSRRPILEKNETTDNNHMIAVERDSENGDIVMETTEREIENLDSIEEESKEGIELSEISNDEEVIKEEKEQNDNELGMENTVDLPDMEKGSLEDLDSETEENVQISPSLEAQLVAVQKQLQALSQLPSAIQITLDAVSKQLASIVEYRENVEIDKDQVDLTSSSKEDEPETEEEFLEDTSTSEKAEAEVLREDSEANSSIAEELEEDTDRQNEPEGGIEEDTRMHVDLTQEEIEAQKKKEELEVKQEKTMEQHISRPIQRPIILPGGRKWSIPEDAIPSFRKPKMSDEKIIETIENNLEVIIGNRKGLTNGTANGRGLTMSNQCTGIVDTCNNRNDTLLKREKVKINFLKYQPTPKNLDYLQRSEVYRLVHDMEPPLKGITSRQEKILAVQDYYEATKEEP